MALVAVEVAGLLALGQYTGWQVVIYEIMLTGLLGILAICCMPVRWKGAVIWWSDENVDSARVDQSVKDARRKGILLLLVGVLLILPGPVADLTGLVLLVLLIAGLLWQHRPGFLTRA